MGIPFPSAVRIAATGEEKTQSVSETVRILGYPTKKHLHNWIYEEKNPPSKRKEYPIVDNSSKHPRNPSLKVKLDAIHRCFELGENIKSVSENIGYSRASIISGANDI